VHPKTEVRFFHFRSKYIGLYMYALQITMFRYEVLVTRDDQCLTADKSATDKLMILIRNWSFISCYHGRRVRSLLL